MKQINKTKPYFNIKLTKLKITLFDALNFNGAL